MFLPIGDSPNPRSIPWMTRALIAANVLVFFFVSAPMNRELTQDDVKNPTVEHTLQEMWDVQKEHFGGRLSRSDQAQWLQSVTRYDVFVFEHGYQPGRPSWIDLLLCMFLHANLLHLIGNMLFLWIFGDNVEARLGRLPYLICYLVTGAVATLAFSSLAKESLTPLVGASGAISGVLGFYYVWFPGNIVRVFVWLGWWMMDVIPIAARWVLFFYLVIDNLLPFLLLKESSVAYGAHIGGFVAGAILAFLLRKVAHEKPVFDVHQRPPWAHRPVRSRDPWARFSPAPEVVVDRDSPEEPGGRFAPPEESFGAALGRKDRRSAVDAFRRRVVTGLEQTTSRQVYEFGEWLLGGGHPGDAHGVFSFYLQRFPTGTEIASVHLQMGLLLARVFGKKVAAREHLLSAIDLSGPGSAVQETARAVLQQM